MRKIIEQTHAEFRFWKACRCYELARPILRILDELTQADVPVEHLRTLRDLAAGTPQADKLHDLLLLLAESHKLNLLDLDNPAHDLEHYRDLVAQIDWLNGATLYVDGFAGFTGQEYAALAATAKVAETTYVTLCLDPHQLDRPAELAEWNCFTTVRRTYDRLAALAREHRIPIGPAVMLSAPREHRFAANQTLARMEEYLSRPANPGKFADPVGVEIVAASDRLAEVNLAAARIIEHVRDQGLRYRDISVVVRELHTYEPYIRDVFEEFDIPYFLDARLPVGRTPLARLICSALGAIVHDYQTSHMLRYLKSGLTGILPEKVPLIENYVLAHGIDGQLWRKPWKYRLDLIGYEDQDGPTANELTLDDLNRCRLQLVGPLERLSKNLSWSGNADQKVAVETLLNGLAALLGDLDAGRRLAELCRQTKAEGSNLSVQVHRQSWRATKELFVQLRLALSGQSLRLDDFLRTLQDSFNELTVGVVPALLDQVLIGSIERSRHPSVRATFVLGFNEAEFPACAEDDSLLTDRDRELIAWQDLARPADIEEHYAREQYYAYIALTRPSEFLHISFAERDRQGRELVPSRYLALLEPILGKPVKKSAIPASIENLSTALVDAIDKGIGKDSENRWLSLAKGLLADSKKRDALRRYLKTYFDENRADLAGELAIGLYPESLSFTQLESFYRCPFQHFCRYGLKIAPRPLFRLEPVDLGRFRHLVMRRTWEHVQAITEPHELTRPALAEEVIRNAINECTRSMGQHVLFSTSRNRYIFEQVTADLVLALRWQLRVLLMSRFRPVALEQKFSLPISDANPPRADKRLVGRVDRIDLARSNGVSWATVIDYKSSFTRFDFAQWYAGVQMQLAGYMLAALDSDLLGSSPNQTTTPAAAVFFPLTPKGNRRTNTLDEIAPLFAASGLVSRLVIDLLIDRQQSVGKEFGFQLGKSGEPIYIGRGSLVEPDQFLAILGHTRKLVLVAAEAIYTGQADIQPYRQKTSVCPFCDFRAICRFDPFVNRYRNQPAMDKPTVLNELMKEQ
jgi:ATP-dependent helicase/nuclease subunit B